MLIRNYAPIVLSRKGGKIFDHDGLHTLDGTFYRVLGHRHERHKHNNRSSLKWPRCKRKEMEKKQKPEKQKKTKNTRNEQ